MALSGFHRDELLKMIRELPLGCQVIFNLYAIEGYTHKEIAKKLNISEGTSKSQYSRAKSLLQVKRNRQNSPTRFTRPWEWIAVSVTMEKTTSH